MTQLAEVVQDFINNLVIAGFDSQEAIIAKTIESFAGDYPADTFFGYRIRLFAETALIAHFIEQRQWTHETDCERLDDAFAELDNAGIVARQNFSCCQSCGHLEILEEMVAFAEFRLIRGYVFYHEQDTEMVACGNKLYLAYGALDGDDENALAIANEIADTLRRHGLPVTWNGIIRDRIVIAPIVWQRRRLLAGQEL